MSQALELSVIVPVFNEVENIALLWMELDAVLGRLGRSAEIVFVDDGSTDGSADAIRAVMAQDPRVRLLCFDANAGLTAAFHAGYEAARGQIVATLDGDLQNDPQDLPLLLAAPAPRSLAEARLLARRQRHSQLAHGRRRAGQRLQPARDASGVCRRDPALHGHASVRADPAPDGGLPGGRGPGASPPAPFRPVQVRDQEPCAPSVRRSVGGSMDDAAGRPLSRPRSDASRDDGVGDPAAPEWRRSVSAPVGP